MRKILVAIPTIADALSAKIAEFTYSLGRSCGEKVEFKLQIKSGSSSISFPVEFQRNQLVKDFLGSDCDTLWFVDSDTRPSDNSAQLLAIDAPIVGGIYPMINADEHSPLVWSMYKRVADAFEAIPLPPPGGGSVFEIGGLGTGCMLIRREVFEDPAMKLGEDEDTGIPIYFRTLRRPTGQLVETDDLDFCQRAGDAGYKLVVDTDVRWGHLKVQDVQETFTTFQEAFRLGCVVGRREAGQPRASRQIESAAGLRLA